MRVHDVDMFCLPTTYLQKYRLVLQGKTVKSGLERL